MARLVGDRATRFHPAAIVILGLCLGLLPVLAPGLGCLSPRPRSGFEVPPPFSSVAQEEPGDSDQRPPTAPAPLALPEGLDEISIELGGEGEPTLQNSREINLRQVLDEALAGNIDLALARAEEKVAEGRVSVAVGRFLPSIDLGAVARNRDGRVQGSFGVLRDVDFNTFAGDVALRYTFNPASEIYRWLAERDHLGEATYLRLSVRQRLLVHVTELYQTLILAKIAVRIAQERVDYSQRIVDLARARVAANLGSQDDVSRAEFNLSVGRQRRVDAQRLWRDASSRLAVVLRQSPDSVLDPGEAALAPRRLPSVGEDEVSEVLGSRPDIVAARRSLKAIESERSVIWWDLLGPDVYAEVRETLIGDEVDDLDERFDHGIFVGWSLSLAKFARTRQASSELETARLRLMRVQEQAAGEVQLARNEIRAAVEKIPLADDGLGAANDSLRFSLARLQNGASTVLEVIESQDAVAQARLDLAREVAAFNMAQVRLLAAAGVITPEMIVPN